MVDVKLKLVLVGLQTDIISIVKAHSEEALVQSAVEADKPSAAIQMLLDGSANCVLLEPFYFEWRDTQELLQFCTSTFPVCLIRSPSYDSRSRKTPGKWFERMSHYYFIPSDVPVTELPDQVRYAIRGCHRYLLKKVIHSNLDQMISESASVPQLADKALQTATAIKEIELQEKSELGRNLGLNEAQMRAIFDETLGDSRQAAQRSQFANFAALGAGLLVLLAAAGASLFGGSKDPWTFATGGMGAAALIAALVTSPSKRIGSSASRQVYIQTAYFSFLQQVRLLNSLSPDTTLQRSERLEGATDKLLERLKSLPGDQ